MKKVAPAARSKARRFALQALYQAQLTGDSLALIENQFREDHDMKRVDTEYLHDALKGVSESEEELWEVLVPCLDRPKDELTPVERGILLLGAYELQFRIDVPYRVVLDEAIELAQMFGANESFKFINSVLDRLSKTLRTAEPRPG